MPKELAELQQDAAILQNKLTRKEEDNSSLRRELFQLRQVVKSGMYMDQHLQRELERNRQIINLSCDMHWNFYPETTLTIFSEEYSALTGYKRLTYEDVALSKLIHPDDRDAFKRQLTAVLEERQAGFSYELRWLCADGKYLWLHNRCFGIRNAEGKIDNILGLSNDQTEFRRQQHLLLEEQLKNHILLKTATDYIWEYDLERDVFTFSRELADVLGLEQELQLGPGQNFHACLREVVQKALGDQCPSDIEDSKVHAHIRLQNRKTDENIWLEVSFAPLKDIKGKYYKYIGTMFNISERKRLEEAVRHDPLTRALNRRAILGVLEAAFNKFRDSGTVSAVLFFDLDNFKRVNDTYGHAAGDRVLQETVNLLYNTTRHNASICRWGGEEFVVLCDFPGRESLRDYAEHVRVAVEQHTVHWGDTEIHLTLSAGVSYFLPGDEDYEEAIQRADEAVYSVKKAHKNAVLLLEK